jgi:uncharacterized membrane protein YdfJ with MMPL/SSD domain
VMRFPRVAVALSGGVLVALAMPLFGMHTSFLGGNDIPHRLPIERTYAQIQHAFPGAPQPAQVVVSAADVTAPPVRAALARMERLALASGEASEPITTRVNAAHTVAEIDISQPGNGQNKASMHALGTLRDHILPATLGQLSGVTYAVGGAAAGTSDFNQMLSDHAPIVFAFVLGLAFLLLLITFRSIVIPLTSCPSARRTGCSCGCSRTGTCRACSASTPTARSWRGFRSSCSRCCSGSRWTTTCSS